MLHSTEDVKTVLRVLAAGDNPPPQKMRSSRKWNIAVDAFVVDYVVRFGKHWSDIARLLGGRENNQTADAIRNRFVRITHGTRSPRGPASDARLGWSAQEDEALLTYVVTHGTDETNNDWLGASVLLGRTPRSCRRRYERLCE